MNKAIKQTQRFTKHEERANAISHAIGTLLAIVGWVLLVIYSFATNNIWYKLSFTTFGASMVVLYLSSTLNHSLKQGKAKDFFHNFDQVAIFLLIAGTYTPLSLVVLKSDLGFLMFGLQWGSALAGILAKLVFPNKFEKGVNLFFIIAYVFMGWMLLFFIVPLIKHLPLSSLINIFIGGAFYTLGTLFFKWERLPFSHLIWHIFVMLGTLFHWIAIMQLL